MKRLILHIYTFFEHRTSLLHGLLLVIIVGLALAVSRISFVEDISTFIPQNEENSRANYAFQHMGAANKLVVSITANDGAHDPYRLSTVADSMAEALQTLDTAARIKTLFYRVNEADIFNVMQFVVAHMPYYLTADDYLRIDSLLAPQAMDSALAADRQLLISPMGGVAKQLVSIDPLMFSAPLLAHLNGLQRPENYQVIDGYLFTKDTSEALLIVESTFPVSETSQNALLLKDINKAIAQVETSFHNEINVDCIGAAVISVENATRIKKDTILSTLIALIGILGLLFYFFRDWRAPLIMLFSISFGALFALAFLALFKGSVSIIAVGIGSIMVGIAANYPIHFLAHYQQGYSKRQTLKDITAPLITGNITTVGAFLSLVFISSDAMKDLGLFAAMLLIGAILFVVLFLPHLFNRTLFRGKRASNQELRFGRIANFQLESRRWVVLLVVLLTIPLYLFSRRPAFESDMSAINYMTAEQRTQMQHMIASVETQNPILYCAAEGATIEEALQSYETAKPIIDSLHHSGALYKVSGIDIFLPSQTLQQQRLAQWNDFWSTRKDDLIANLQRSATQQGFRPEAFQPFIAWLNTSWQPIPIEDFQPILNTFAANWLSLGQQKQIILSQLEVQPHHAEAVDTCLNAIAPSVYAFSNQSLLSQMVESLSDDFDWVLYVCGLIVLLFLTFSFGRLELSLITFLPLLIGWVWILGLMGIFNLKFNIVNIILATFIFGMGDDYAIFVTEGMMYEYTYRRKMLASYKNSVFLSASIMLIGIGALIVAQHPAMRSLAEVTIVGMCSVVLMAYLFPPLLYRWLTERKGRLRQYPITLWNLFKTIFSMTVFLILATLLTFVGFFLAGNKSSRGKYRFHCCICTVMRWCIRLLPQVKHRINNPTNEDFSRPAIIISNHQSQLDLLYLIALNPKIICLTNQWVWNCPFYKHIIHLADYYPIMDHLENSEHLLRKAISEGYSIMIFPEGTRSEDCSIGRFHKGAFYLAQRLGVDILPVMLHGVGHIFPKHEFILRKGCVTVDVMSRITLSNEVSYSQYAHQFRHQYQEQYHQLSLQLETPNYLSDKVIHSYLYKGKTIEQQVRQSLRRHHNYQMEISQLPDTGIIELTDHCWGVYALLAALTKKDLQIHAHIPDPDHYEVAIHNQILPPNLTILPVNQ